MKSIPYNPEAHIYVCTNERSDDKSSCKKVGGHAFFTRLKDELIQKGLRSERWITRTGCLGFCNDTGCVVAIYKRGQPKPVFLTEVTEKDYDTVWSELTGLERE